ncbi:MAG: hypothetical protein K2K89_10515 [Ruminococcus sp.]|nr:hypothetical protein [Ruminococcus sp.]
MNITEGTSLEMDNVLSCRKKLTEYEMKLAVDNMLGFIEKVGAKTVGPVVKATYQLTNGIADTEILIPIDRKPLIHGDYEFKPVFRLKNALKLEYTGKYTEYPTAVKKYTDYILSKKLVPITAGYSIEKKFQDKTGEDLFSITTYVGISENIL